MEAFRGLGTKACAFTIKMGLVLAGVALGDLVQRIERTFVQSLHDFVIEVDDLLSLGWPAVRGANEDSKKEADPQDQHSHAIKADSFHAHIPHILILLNKM
jgi:hypothetical protein